MTSPAQQLYRQLCDDFPPATAKWVLARGTTVTPLRKVPLAMIDTANAKNWDAEKHPAKILKFRQKMRAGSQKPIVLVKRPGKPKLMVADGHHRTCAAIDEKKPPLAWVVTVPAVTGPWDEMHARQVNQKGEVKLATPATQAPPPTDTSQPPQASQQNQLNDALALAAAATLAGMAVPPGLGLAAIGLMVARQEGGAALVARFSRAGIPPQALYAAIEVQASFQPEVHGMTGPATRRMIVLNQVRRGQYLVAAARRVAGAMKQAHSRRESVLAAIQGAMADERRFYAQHIQAGWNRMNAAAQVDSAYHSVGMLLGWNTVLDSHTSPECRAADGRNFLADRMPAIGYPGMVHPHCRCWPGKPHPGAKMLALRHRQPVHRCPVREPGPGWRERRGAVAALVRLPGVQDDLDHCLRRRLARRWRRAVLDAHRAHCRVELAGGGQLTGPGEVAGD